MNPHRQGHKSTEPWWGLGLHYGFLWPDQQGAGGATDSGAPTGSQNTVSTGERISLCPCGEYGTNGKCRMWLCSYVWSYFSWNEKKHLKTCEDSWVVNTSGPGSMRQELRKKVPPGDWEIPLSERTHQSCITKGKVGIANGLIKESEHESELFRIWISGRSVYWIIRQCHALSSHSYAFLCCFFLS